MVPSFKSTTISFLSNTIKIKALRFLKICFWGNALFVSGIKLYFMVKFSLFLPFLFLNFLIITLS